MQRNQLNDMTIFVEVARLGGFRAAADYLNLGPGSVSEAIQRFEDRLGLRLFERTTRSVALTHAGETLYQRSMPAISELENAVRDLHDTKKTISGVLRLNAPRSCGSLFLDALISEYSNLYPDVGIEITFDDQKIDLVTSKVDAVIRSNKLVEQDTHAVSIGPSLATTIVASPAYLARSENIKTPKDLNDHDGICFAFNNSGDLIPWSFKNKNDEYIVMPKAKIIVNDLDSMIRYAEAGLGVCYVYSYSVESHIQSKRLVSLLENKTSPISKYTINYLTKRHMPSRLRAFIDLAKVFTIH